jgi:hypothetical protein
MEKTAIKDRIAMLLLSFLLAFFALLVSFVLSMILKIMWTLPLALVLAILVEGIGYLFGSPIDFVWWWENYKILIQFFVIWFFVKNLLVWLV